MTARPLVAVVDNVMENSMQIARNVEVWIFGAFGALVLGACLGGPSERAAPATAVSAVAETELAQPQGAAQPMYVVYVTAKRLSPEEKRALRGQAG
ncbi:MAG: hypothetical protein JWP72_1600 [Massilia sp.]|nr:hypothetical protein [Massilia sp.]